MDIHIVPRAAPLDPDPEHPLAEAMEKVRAAAQDDEGFARQLSDMGLPADAAEEVGYAFGRCFLNSGISPGNAAVTGFMYGLLAAGEWQRQRKRGN